MTSVRKGAPEVASTSTIFIAVLFVVGNTEAEVKGGWGGGGQGGGERCCLAQPEDSELFDLHF